MNEKNKDRLLTAVLILIPLLFIAEFATGIVTYGIGMFFITISNILYKISNILLEFGLYSRYL